MAKLDRVAPPLKFMILEGAAAQSEGRVSTQKSDIRTVAGSLTQWQRVSDAFFAAVECFGDRTALIHGSSTYQYDTLGHYARCVAHGLLADEFHRTGDRVALMLDNGPEFIAAYYGVLAAGGVLVPLPANIESSRLERISRICDISRVVTSRRIAKRRTEVSADRCDSIDLAAADSSARPTVARPTVARPTVARPTVARPTVARPTVQPFCVDGQSLAMIMFTSGSSGDPKGVMLSDKNLLANTESILQYLPITRDDRALALLPFYHAFGHSILQTHLLAGATLVVDGNMAFPNSVLEAMERHRATSFSAVPEGYYSLLTMSELRERELPHLRYMSVAGGALKPDSVVDVAQSIAPAEFFVMYGQTEASARLTYLPAQLAQELPGSIGQSIPGVELRVVDGQGCEAQVNETGELCARGDNVMLGYWNDPQGTSQVLSEGWLRTGDLAAQDQQGFFHIRARKNDLVKVQGFRIHPREVEDAIAGHFPGLRIIVVPYEHRGTTRLALYGITSRVEQYDVDELRRICMRELPRHKVPSFVEVLNQAPLNASMKLDRTALKRRAELHAHPVNRCEQDCRPPNKLSA